MHCFNFNKRGRRKQDVFYNIQKQIHGTARLQGHGAWVLKKEEQKNNFGSSFTGIAKSG